MNGKNPDTDYRTGKELHFEAGVTKHLTKELSVGLIGAQYRQTLRLWVIAEASKGLVQLSRDGEIVVLGSFEELRRRLGDLVRLSLSARRLGTSEPDPSNT